jgi:choline dehydrogenase-like flavoprotein
MASLIAGLKLARKIGKAPALAPFLAAELILDGAADPDDNTLADYVRSFAKTVYHPVGTCRMGLDANSVVNPYLQVQGIGGLYVVDASIMPSMTSGNTNAPAIMIAEKAADLILNRAPLVPADAFSQFAKCTTSLDTPGMMRPPH